MPSKRTEKVHSSVGIKDGGCSFYHNTTIPVLFMDVSFYIMQGYKTGALRLQKNDKDHRMHHIVQETIKFIYLVLDKKYRIF